MAQRYEGLKRTVLKELLKARDKAPRGKAKAVIIGELMEDDRNSVAPSEGSETSEWRREVQWRLALYGTDPSADIIGRVLADTDKLRQAALPEGSEDVDGFLQDFERQCALQEVAVRDWVPILAGKLTGRAAEAYRAVADEDCMVYERVKEHLLAHYALTPEAYRVRFRALRRGTQDSYAEWGHRMQQALRSWIQGCQAIQPDQIVQLLLLEQFYNYSPPEVRDWVRDRRPLTLSEATRLADEYQDARRVAPPVIRAPPPRFHPAPVTPCSPRTSTRPPAPPTPAPQVGPRCYGCNQIGHIQDRCPLNTHRPAPSRAAHPPSRAAAYCCHQEPEPTATLEEDWGILHEANPVQAATQDNRQHHRQQVRVNGQLASGLRDTGATLILAQPHLIHSAASTGYSVAVRVAGGHVYRIPTARVHLDWGTNARDVEVGVMKNLPSEVLLGNDLGLLTSTFEDPHPMPRYHPQPSAEGSTHRLRGDHGKPDQTNTPPPWP
uniref:CCHC-type domain-containing protein n=1 Tax=Leptobrachium leishanense TaxID=445787 RepID=A0A8C5LU82_9ANUR